jgi:hypothetical protein
VPLRTIDKFSKILAKFRQVVEYFFGFFGNATFKTSKKISQNECAVTKVGFMASQSETSISGFSPSATVNITGYQFSENV